MRQSTSQEDPIHRRVFADAATDMRIDEISREVSTNPIVDLITVESKVIEHHPITGITTESGSGNIVYQDFRQMNKLSSNARN